MPGGGRYFNVDAGFLGMHEYYVPFDAVTEVKEDAVFVDVTNAASAPMGRPIKCRPVSGH